MAVNYFYTDELIAKASNYLGNIKEGSTNYTGLFPGYPLPSNFSDFSYYDKAYLEWYVCKNVDMHYS